MIDMITTDMVNGSIIYFDNAATTPLCNSAREILLQDFANPSSPHALGLIAERAIKSAAKELSNILSCRSDEIIFTSGGTESNNLGILGAAFGLKAARGRNRPMHILATDQEHPSVTEPLGYLASLPGFSVTYAAPSKWEAHICENTAMICITQVGSETGDIFDISLIKKRFPETVVFVDGAQGFCKVDQQLTGIDIYAFSGHKIHGPMGIGGLMVRKESGLRLQPIIYGGGQQNRMRPGTENVSGILAMAASVKEQTYYKSKIEQEQPHRHIKNIKNILITLEHELPDTYINQVTNNVSPYILNMSFLGVRGETLTSMLSDHSICVSMGTACRTNKKASALESMGFSRERAESAVRLSFSNMNTEKEALQAKEIIKSCVLALRKIKPRK